MQVLILVRLVEPLIDACIAIRSYVKASKYLALGGLTF